MSNKIKALCLDHYDCGSNPTTDLNDTMKIVESLNKDKIYLFVDTVLRMGRPVYKATFAEFNVDDEGLEGVFIFGEATRMTLAEAICVAALKVKGLV